MASAPQQSRLPVLYNDLVPLNTNDHSKYKTRPMESADFFAKQHAIPLTVEEFPQAQRHYPIVFSSGEDPVPLALMGLNDGTNVYVGEDGKMRNPVYVPAFIRRYPFMLARLRPDAEELSLCFDPTSPAVGEFEEGEALFENGEATENTKNILQFCEQFERAVANTTAFVSEIKKYDILMDGELKIEHPSLDRPFLYQGFKMVNEEKLRELRGDQLRTLNQNGMLPLLHAHLFSLQIMREVFAQQAAEGKLPQVPQEPIIQQAPADAQIN
ncbi:MAG: SapC family protein [Blastomonas sp.]